MQFEEMGNMNGKVLMLLPGTACTWQINFKYVIEELGKTFHLVCVNYDGFEGNPEVIFPGMIPVTEKIEKYINEKFGGRIDGAYGSSLGGSFVGQLIMRKNVHIDHGFIGSSDLDQGNKIVAKIMTAIVGPWIKNASTPKGRKKLNKNLKRFLGMESNEEMESFMNEFSDGFLSLHPDTIMKEFYSDYITKLEENISVENTMVHFVYAVKMGKKYEKRYRKYFKNPDIHPFNMQHEAWMFEKKWREPVVNMICECMEKEYAL